MMETEYMCHRELWKKSFLHTVCHMHEITVIPDLKHTHTLWEDYNTLSVFFSWRCVCLNDQSQQFDFSALFQILNSLSTCVCVCLHRPVFWLIWYCVRLYHTHTCADDQDSVGFDMNDSCFSCTWDFRIHHYICVCCHCWRWDVIFQKWVQGLEGYSLTFDPCTWDVGLF